MDGRKDDKSEHGEGSGLQNLENSELLEDDESVDNTVRNLSIAVGLFGIAFAGNVFQATKTRYTPGKDASKAYNLMAKYRLLTGGHYIKKPPWLVRKYGDRNVTDEMIEKDIEEGFLKRRSARERLDLDNWKSLRIQRAKQQQKRVSPEELEKRADEFKEMKLGAMFRGGLLSLKELDEVKETLASREAMERMSWEHERADAFIGPFAPRRINITGEDPIHHFAESEAQTHSGIKIESSFEEMIILLEDLVSRQGKSYYDVLGIKSNASMDDVKDAYRQELKKWHPDTYEGQNPEEASKKFREVLTAYQVLADEQARGRYDQVKRQAE
ncbi:hypothetical protein NDN08_002744 [Rhodosorus marinus]|uniref:J domain-containing protein n=1 Tax=Rhodosorus marinus TaxID=101924 RepID=A0AAV8V0D4_9RHOD|nr:hypothetical protein NDN08_002744 [Rhodosorus marinus]